MKKLLYSVTTFILLNVLNVETVFADSTKVVLHTSEDSIVDETTINQVITEPAVNNTNNVVDVSNSSGSFTGDNTNLIIYGLIILVAITVVGVLCIKKHNSKEV